MHLIKAASYDAVVFDIEKVVGPSSTMIPLFTQAFAKAKEVGLKTVLTTSHSAPYNTDTP